MTKPETRIHIQTQLETAFAHKLITAYEVNPKPDTTTEFVMYLPEFVYTTRQIMQLDDLFIKKYNCTPQITINQPLRQIVITVVV